MISFNLVANSVSGQCTRIFHARLCRRGAWIATRGALVKKKKKMHFLRLALPPTEPTRREGGGTAVNRRAVFRGRKSRRPSGGVVNTLLLHLQVDRRTVNIGWSVQSSVGARLSRSVGTDRCRWVSFLTPQWSNKSLHFPTNFGICRLFFCCGAERSAWAGDAKVYRWKRASWWDSAVKLWS